MNTGEPTAAILARVDVARAARERLRRRPLRVTVAALAAAARRWRDDAALGGALPAAARLSPEMIATIVPLAAAALDEAAMRELVEHELGPDAADRPAPDGPVLVAHVLASNVPALALPAIALGCLAGAAVLVKSGRDDPLTAPAFRDALAAVDPDLAATVVTTYWPGGDREREDAVLGSADVVVATGGDVAVSALRARSAGRFLAHGPRLSLVALAEDTDEIADAIAFDIALHDQRGCLSPHAVYALGDARGLARRLAAALDALAVRLPTGPAEVEERAAARVLRDRAEWEPGTEVHETRAGTVLYEERVDFRPTGGRRTVRVHPLSGLEALPGIVPRGTIECVGLAGTAGRPLVDALRTAGVARVCPPGRMQQPSLSWPRGQLAPLGSLLGRLAGPLLRVDT